MGSDRAPEEGSRLCGPVVVGREGGGGVVEVSFVRVDWSTRILEKETVSDVSLCGD